ncbi:lipase family protein [uncultured Corynebacterium sp.]|uniref:lipase family protein n=1 Tax=uncultured Corynebacterium sp. TaxID=159447 RepID=UPI0025E1F5AE|nr:lipase family protein [uncultured Corynebacterium sp.]
MSHTPRTTASRSKRAAMLASLASVAVGASMLSVPAASAEPDVAVVPEGVDVHMSSPQELSEGEVAADFEGDNAFYMPPEQIPTAPGSVIRREAMDLLVTVPNFDGPWPGKAERFMYTSNDNYGKATAVTGMVMEPIAEWTGEGPRPTVVYGSGTIGQGDQCAPSRVAPTLLNFDAQKESLGLNYELLFANLMLREGVRVVMTDYIGLGTPGTHTYMNRLDQGHAMLDAARAVPELTGEDSPIGFWGYSQGGGAAAAAAELAESYAPEVDVRGTFAGAPPADLEAVAGIVEDNLIVGVLGYTINGLLERHPESAYHVDEIMNGLGKKALIDTRTQCIADSILEFGALGATIPDPTGFMTNDGRTIVEHIQSNPRLKAMTDRQLIGTLRPNAPVLVVSSINDDAIPNTQARMLSERWRELGADVEFRSLDIPPIFPRSALGHLAPMPLGFFDAKDWLMGQFNGVDVAPGSTAGSATVFK